MSIPINGGNMIASGRVVAGTFTYGPTTPGGFTFDSDDAVKGVTIRPQADVADVRVAFSNAAIPTGLTDPAGTLLDATGLGVGWRQGDGEKEISYPGPSGAKYMTILCDANCIVTIWGV